MVKRLLPLLGLPLFTATATLAAPFSLSPESFRNWLNATQQTGWTSGNKMFFDTLGSCSESAWSNSYNCYRSYVKIADPRGSRVCVASVEWSGNYTRHDGTMVFGEGVSVKRIRDCRWLKDPRFVDN